jgi:hypothetical protein
MKKRFTAEMLLIELLDMKARHYDLSKIELSYRHDWDSDVEPIACVCEGIYDAETNNVLEELVFVTDNSEFEDDDYPFNEGDDYYTIEDGEVIKSCWDDVSESDYDENPNQIYFAFEENAIRYLKFGH